MSILTLPSSRMPKLVHEDKANAPLINASLYEYLDKLPAHPSQYAALPAACNYPAQPSFFKLVELFQVHALPAAPLRIMHVGTPNATALMHLRGTALDEHVLDSAPKTVDLLISDADLYASLRAACRVQRLGGAAVVAVEELSSRATVQLVYLMTALYAKVSVYSPALYTKDKYLIGSNYGGGEMPERPFEFPISLYFLTRLEEINAVVGQAQMDFIRSDTKSDQSCVEWRETYFKPASAKC